MLLIGNVAFMLVLVISNAHERAVIIVSGFDDRHCLDSRDWVRRKGYYKDEDGVYRLESAVCVRERVGV